MCELFGMSSLRPATVRPSIEEFARHGGLTGPHTDGWGIAFHDGADVRLLREPEPAAGSPWIPFVCDHEVRSSLVISHIRHALRGPRALKNTQPFCRELGGRAHVFAHNGFLDGVDDLDLGTFRPIGDTDSEVAFCHLLTRLQPIWSAKGFPPDAKDILPVVAEVAERLAAMGPANFLYSDGETLFAHSDRRRTPGGTIEPPGLHVLVHNGPARTASLAAPGIEIKAGEQPNVLIASLPLSGEAWRPLAEGTVLAVSRGSVVASMQRSNRETSLRNQGHRDRGSTNTIGELKRDACMRLCRRLREGSPPAYVVKGPSRQEKVFSRQSDAETYFRYYAARCRKEGPTRLTESSCEREAEQ